MSSLKYCSGHISASEYQIYKILGSEIWPIQIWNDSNLLLRSAPGVVRKYPWDRNLSEWSKNVIKGYSSIYKFHLGLFLQGTKFGPSNLNIQLSNHLTEYDIFLKSLQRNVKVLSSKDRTTKCFLNGHKWVPSQTKLSIIFQSMHILSMLRTRRRKK